MKKSRKKSKDKKIKKETIQTYEGFSVGDIVWGIKVDGRIVQGEVLKFFPKDSIEPAMAIRDFSDGSYRTIAVSTASFEKIKKPSKKKS